MTLPSPDSKPDPEISSPRLEQILAIVAGLIARRAAGELVDEAAILAAHPELSPELGEHLAAATRIWQAQRAAERAGSLDDPIDALPMAELDEPLLVLSGNPIFGPEDCPVIIHGYRIIEEISRGGQATVYKAVQEATERMVAVKVLSGGRTATSAARIRFDREVKLLAGLNHPNIVSIIDRGRTDGGAFYLAMEYVDGPTLDEYFRQRRPPAMAEVLRVFGQIAKALAEAHRRGIVHRDLKPSNVRVDQHGEPKLLDFGLARLLTQEDVGLTNMPTLTLPNQIVGSVPWTSPEQAQSEPADHRADIYSFGFMLYHVVTGRFPFPMGNLVETLQHIVAGDHKPLDSGIPALDDLVSKCIARNPADRYQSVADLMCALGAVNNGSGARWKARARRWALATVVIGVVTATVCGATLWWTGQQSRLNPPQQAQGPAPRITNRIGMQLALIPHGFFMMGSPKDEPGRSNIELQHPVELSNDFYMGRTEVTQRQYRAVMEGPGPATAATIPAGEYAMTGVSWEEAKEFCRRLSELDHQIYRLPTEAEWEYACRAGTSDAFGDSVPESTGWFGLEASVDAPPVAGKQMNTWGLFDMHGGVAEWCLTGSYGYAPVPQRDPRPMAGLDAAVRGGNWRSPAARCRAATRDFAALETKSPLIGFRVVMQIP